MKIRITKPLPVEKHARPEVGGVYEVVRHQTGGGVCVSRLQPEMYFIKVGKAQVGVHPTECEIVEA